MFLASEDGIAQGNPTYVNPDAPIVLTIKETVEHCAFVLAMTHL